MCPAQSRCSINGNYNEIKAGTQWEGTTEACWWPPWKATKMLNHQTWVEHQGHTSLRPWVFPLQPQSRACWQHEYFVKQKGMSRDWCQNWQGPSGPSGQHPISYLGKLKHRWTKGQGPMTRSHSYSSGLQTANEELFPAAPSTWEGHILSGFPRTLNEGKIPKA